MNPQGLAVTGILMVLRVNVMLPGDVLPTAGDLGSPGIRSRSWWPSHHRV